MFDKQVLVRELMQDLSETEKDFMWRRHVEGQTIDEIAETEKLTVAQVKYVLDQAANQMLRSSLRRK